MIDYEKLGRQIKTERTKQEITQEQLSKMTKLSLSHISAVERGATKVGLKALLLIADALNVPMDFLLSKSSNSTVGKSFLLNEITEMLTECSTYEINFIEELIQNALISLRKLESNLKETSNNKLIEMD